MLSSFISHSSMILVASVLVPCGVCMVLILVKINSCIKTCDRILNFLKERK